MPGPHSAYEGLTPDAREACRLDAVGTSREDIAQRLGVHVSTVSNWRAQPAYQSHLHDLLAEADRAAIGQARRAREASMRVVLGVVARAAQQLGPDKDLGPQELASIGRMVLDCYRTVSAQVGPVERHAVEATVRTLSDEVAAARLIAAGELAPDDED